MHGRKQPDIPQPVEIQVNITDRHSIEQIALEVQRALAMVQDYGAAGLEKFRFRLLPLDLEGEPIILRDGQGEPVTIINIPDVPAEPVYRVNEPGLGVTPRSGPVTKPDPAAKPPGAMPPRR